MHQRDLLPKQSPNSQMGVWETVPCEAQFSKPSPWWPTLAPACTSLQQRDTQEMLKTLKRRPPHVSRHQEQCDSAFGVTRRKLCHIKSPLTVLIVQRKTKRPAGTNTNNLCRNGLSGFKKRLWKHTLKKQLAYSEMNVNIHAFYKCMIFTSNIYATVKVTLSSNVFIRYKWNTFVTCHF